MRYASVREAGERNGLLREVRKFPIFAVGNGVYKQAPGAAVGYVGDDGQPVEVFTPVGSRFTPVQFTESMAWVDQLVQEVPGAYVNGAGRHKGKTWLRVRLPFEAPVAGARKVGDIVAKELWVMDSFGGTVSLTYAFRSVRLWCTNGMTSMVDESVQKIKHTKSIRERLHEVKASLNLIRQRFDVELRIFNKWAETRLHDDVAELAYTMVLCQYGTMQEASTRLQEVRDGLAKRPRNLDTLMDAYRGAPGAEPGSVWGWYNGLTYHLTHQYGNSDTARPLSWNSGSAKAKEAHGVEVANILAEVSGC